MKIKKEKKMSCVRIERVWSDINMIELEFDANSVNIQSRITFYVKEYELLDLQKRLLEFPRDTKDVVEWSVGEDKLSSYAYFKLRVFLYDKQGHVALEIIMDNKLVEPYSMKSHFYIPTEVGSINELGRKLSDLLTDDGAYIDGIELYR
jgi:hypothetical protein